MVTLVHPAGFPVEVSEGRAEELLKRGYKRKKQDPKPASKK